MFNCGMLAVELPTDAINALFDRFAGKDTDVQTDFSNSRLVFRCGEDEETIAFNISDFDRKLVTAGGWVDFADQHY
jgi:3-isopropylmalate/(R)-2-methylmalate dehydratase small subunit